MMVHPHPLVVTELICTFELGLLPFCMVFVQKKWLLPFADGFPSSSMPRNTKNTPARATSHTLVIVYE